MPATVTSERTSVKSESRTMRYDPLSCAKGHLSITTTTGRKVETSNYIVTADGRGSESFEVERLANEIEEGAPASYRVCIRPGQESCECKGWTYCRSAVRTCRHVAACRRLREMGRI